MSVVGIAAGAAGVRHRTARQHSLTSRAGLWIGQ